MTPTQAINRLRMYFPAPEWTVDVQCQVRSSRHASGEIMTEFSAGAYAPERPKEDQHVRSEYDCKSLSKAVAQVIRNRKPHMPLVVSQPVESFFAAAEGGAS